MQLRLIDLYHRLPAPGRDLAASFRGAILSRRRYGPETADLVRRALEREHWSEGRWSEWLERRTAETLNAARRNVPAYREVPGDTLAAFPVLSKQAVRQRAIEFESGAPDLGPCFIDHTSGSTGSPLAIKVSRPALREWYALHEARTRRWYGVDRRDRWAILGGQPIVPAETTRPPYWVWNAPMRQLYLSSYHLSQQTVGDYVAALRRHRVRYLLGYPSAMDGLAGLVLEQGVRPPSLAVAIANAEPLYDRQRRAIVRAFDCPVRETYGLAELVVAASECQEGGLHLWPEAGVVEVLDDDDRPLPAGESGRLVCTGLLNPAMPLIRYDTGDRGRLKPPNERCACGRTLPLLGAVEGRQDDVVVLPSGRRLGRLDPIFKGGLPIRECQVLQVAPDSLVFRVVPFDAFDAAAEKELLDSARRFLGSEIDLIVEKVEHLERGPSGKLRGVVSEI